MELKISGYLKTKEGKGAHHWNHFEVSEDEIFDWLNQRFQDGDFGCPINLNREDLIMDCEIEGVNY